MTRRRKRMVLGIGFAPALVLLFFAVYLAGCFGGPRMATTVPGLDASGPRLVHVVGWRGPVAGDRDFLRALRDGGCPHEMATFDWTDGHDAIFALRYAQRSSEPTRRLADHLTALARDGSGRPIDVTADSAGTGVLLGALAKLPSDVRVRTVVLSSPAVSRGFDLGPVLAHVGDRLIAFRSGRDWFILGLGTWLFGTVDGRHASGAGRVGFDAVDPKLVQIDYDATWSGRFGNGGGHAESLAPGFAKGYVAGLLLEGR